MKVEGKKAIGEMFTREFAAAPLRCIVEHLFTDGEWAILDGRDPLGLTGAAGSFTA